MSKTWGKIGAWAADAEAAEAEELAAASTFPTLSQAVTVAPKKKNKTKMSLHEFTMSSASPGLTTAEMLRLPTRPQERSADEFSSRDSSWGGGRRSYGGGYENDDRRASNPSRVSNSDNMPDLPSRADGADNWAMGKKKNVPSFDSGRPSKYNSLGGGRADDMDTWGAGKRAPVESGFRDPVGPGASERPRLILNPPKKEVGSGPEPMKTATTKPSPFGAARPREEVLAEKGLDWKKLESDIEVKKGSSSSRPTSSHSSRPTSSHSNRSEGVGVDGAVKAKPKVNPFGDAKPREVLLEEKGLDWRKIDLELDHRRVDRPETEGEMILKEEINHLKEQFAKQSALNSTTESHEGATADLHDMILSKEKDLELLIHELDNKVRFRPRVSERPGSGAGRVSGPSPRSESFHESRNMEFMERPRSRGTGDMFSRQNDDRRAFQGGMDRGGFMGNRGMDRQRDDGRFLHGGMERGFMGHRGTDRSRERW